MINTIVAIYAITDDLLKAIGHKEDSRCHLSDGEVVTTILVAARFLGGNQEAARIFLKTSGLIPTMLSKSRMNRRIHANQEVVEQLFACFSFCWQNLHETTEYLIDSFPVPVCDNIRISRCRLFSSESYRGYIASKKRYFYGIRVHLLTTATGIPVEFVFLPGATADIQGLKNLPLALPAGSCLYGDKAFTDYTNRAASPRFVSNSANTSAKTQFSPSRCSLLGFL